MSIENTSEPEIIQLSRWASAGAENLHGAGLGMARFVTEAARPRQSTIEDFHAMHLPGYTNQFMMPYVEYLADPDLVFKKIPTEKCWFQILPTDGDDSIKLTVVGNGKSKDEAAAIIANHVEANAAENRCDIFISEFLENVFGGSIVVNSDGELYAEFGPGTQIQYSAGEQTPKYFAHKDIGTIVRYSFEDVRLRTATWNAIKAIPHADGEFFPGYYEFALVGERLRAIFLDYRSSKVFQLETKQKGLDEMYRNCDK